MRVYVMLYNAGTANEGIHTIQTKNGHTVLMFESEDDALRFALMLEAQDFPVPTVDPIDAEEIKAFCMSAGYEWRMIAAGDLQLPPESNVEQTDWDSVGHDASVALTDPADAEAITELSENELDHIRRQLEKLL